MYGGEPKIGQLLNSAWTYADVCRFQILTPPQIFQSQNINSSSSKSNTPIEKSKETADRIDMPPPPSPASSTCSDTGNTVQSSSKYIYYIQDVNVSFKNYLMICLIFILFIIIPNSIL